MAPKRTTTGAGSPAPCGPEGCRRGRLPEASAALPACLLLAVSVATWPVGAQGLLQDDKVFTEKLIADVRYYDTARRWLEELRSRPGLSSADRAEIDSWAIDVLQGEGRIDEVRAALEKFEKEHPGHQRAALGSLEVLETTEFPKVIKSLEQALGEADPQKAEAARAQVLGQFQEAVRRPLDALIASLEKAVAESRKDEAIQKSLRLRNQAELSRVKMLCLLGRQLPAGSAERKKLLEEGLDLATRFVDERYDFYVMQYDAQIQKGVCLLELGRFGEAAEELDVMYTVPPPDDPPYPDFVVKAFQNLRLQANYYGARALNGAGEYSQAVRTLEENVYRKHELIDLTRAEEDPSLRSLAVLARLEYAVALAGAGNVRQALAEIQAVIGRYEGSQDPLAPGFVVDARKALGRIASSGGVELRGRDYYQAAVGLKSERRFEEALDAVQWALVRLDTREFAEYAPLCLNELGELCFLLGRYEESALAYEELCRHYQASELVAKAAQNFLGVVTNNLSGGDRASHAGLRELRQEADAFARRFTANIARYEAMMAQAMEMEKRGEFAAAEKKYLEVPRAGDKGQRIPFYWRAQATARACVLRQWERARQEGDEAALKELSVRLETVLRELPQIEKAALEAKEPAGAAEAALARGQIHFQREEWDAVIQALEIFTGELASDQYHRCAGLGYLGLALCEKRRGAEAARLFSEVRHACREDVGTATLAYALSKYYTREGDEKKAAVYMLEYARHPTSATELGKLPNLMEVVRVLVDGTLISDAQEFMEKARGLAAPDDPELRRQMFFMDAKILMAREEWGAAAERLEQYVKEYRADGSHYEDPYALEMLARSHLKQKVGKKIPTKHLLAAEKYYGGAVGILYPNMRKRPEERDPVLERLYWRWAYVWMQVKYLLGRAGEKVAFGEINVFVTENSHTEMGGPALKKRFLELAARARKGLGKGEEGG